MENGPAAQAMLGSHCPTEHWFPRTSAAVAVLLVACLTLGFVAGTQTQAWLPTSHASRPVNTISSLRPLPPTPRLDIHPPSPQRPLRRSALLRSTAENAAALKGNFDLMAYLKESAVTVEKALNVYVPETLPPHPKVILDAMRHSLLAGGKRIRPALVFAACEMVGGSKATALPTACALEMIHTMSLIHDDLPMMDNDDFRRGKPTCHKVYGEAMALLAGDALLAQSFSLIAQETKGASPDRVLKTIAELGRLVGTEGLVGGQVMDIKMEGMGSNATLETVQYIHMHKTAALLEASVYGGACVGGASDAELEVLRRFAQKIGLAFQIIDDVLDSTMSMEQLGKTAGKDDATDKATYVKVLGLEESRATANRLIAEAKADLVPYGDKAIPLLALADFITSRSN